MSYPTSIFELIDMSDNPVIERDPTVNPLFFQGFSSEKGPENLRVVSGDLFYKLYGREASFAKHGQPLLQAKSIIDNGGTLLAKRVVAENATLANVCVVAHVKQVTKQKVNANNEPLYTDSVTGLETTEAEGNEAIMVQKASIAYKCVSVEDCATMEDISTALEAQLNGTTPAAGTSVYPLFILTDNGRGVSAKRFRITADYNSSKNLEYMRYNFSTIEKSTQIETFTFSSNPDVIEAGVNRSIQNVIKTASNQLQCKLYEGDFLEFLAKVAELSGATYEYVLSNDIFFGRDRKGHVINTIEIDTDAGMNLSNVYGLNLESGTNGAFGDKPFGTPAYTTKLVELFNGTFSNEIYDLDNYKLDLIVDANYPTLVKRAIEALVDFREDAVYLRDMGLGLKSLEDILSANSQNSKSKFTTTYHLSYDIIDPTTRKQIPVTIGYSLCKLMIDHFKNGRSRAVAGQLHNMVIPEAIEGTINFLPKITPAYDQKEILSDNKINYASYFDGLLTLETLTTSQDKASQFSFVNNIFAIQEVVKAIRTKCPKTRYSFIDGKDLERYKEDVEAVINKYANNFLSIKFTYAKDETMIANKIFYATLEVKFRNFVQTEYFKIYALS